MRISDWSSDVCSSDLREAAFRDAEAREREAEAEAKATAMVSEAIARGDVNAVNYFVAQRYVDALGKFVDSANQKTFFLPLEATSLIGAVGGIAEIARDEIGRAHVCTPVTNAHLVCRITLEKKNQP